MWEHKVVERVNGNELQQKLDEASEDGWQLVSTCFCTEDYEFYLFFKRKVD